MFKFLHTRRVGEPVLLAIGLLLLGYGAGHEIVYTLLGVSGAAREVHGYLPGFGIVAALVSLAGFALLLRMFLRDSSGAIASSRSVLLLAALTPSLGFAAGELLELSLASERFADPLLLIGVGAPLQAAIGLLMLALAGFGLRGAREIARIIARRVQRTHGITALLRVPVSPVVDMAGGNPLAALRAWRAPPLASS